MKKNEYPAETEGSKIAAEVRAQANKWTPEYRAEMHRKGMEIDEKILNWLSIKQAVGRYIVFPNLTSICGYHDQNETLREAAKKEMEKDTH